MHPAGGCLDYGYPGSVTRHPLWLPRAHTEVVSIDHLGEPPVVLDLEDVGLGRVEGGAPLS